MEKSFIQLFILLQVLYSAYAVVKLFSLRKLIPGKENFGVATGQESVDEIDKGMAEPALSESVVEVAPTSDPYQRGPKELYRQYQDRLKGLHESEDSNIEYDLATKNYVLVRRDTEFAPIKSADEKASARANAVWDRKLKAFVPVEPKATETAESSQAENKLSSVNVPKVDEVRAKVLDEPIARIMVKERGGLQFILIVKDLNEYARKNRGSASDFAIVKDVVDRPVDAQIEHAEARTSTPLYLGLAGALFGIVTGLHKMSGSIGLQTSLSDPANASGAMTVLTGNLGELLGAVSLAMWASLIGVILTLGLSLGTRWAVATLDEHRNAFFTFYQIEFLPRITRDVNSVLSSLNGTLDKFNTQFGGNVEAMRTSFADNRTAIQEQQRVLEAMRQLSVGGALEGTIKLYKQISEGTAALEKLTPHIERVHYMARQVGESGAVIAGIAGDAKRVAEIAENLTEVTRISHENQRFVNSHMEDLRAGRGEALSATQQIVESFRQNQERLQSRLSDLTQELGGVIQALHQTTEQVVTEATDAIGLIPSQIEPMMRQAFTTATVDRVAKNSKEAANAAKHAHEEVTKTQHLRSDVAALLDKQYAMINRLTTQLATLERHHATNSSAIETLLRRRPWWWMTSQKPRVTPPPLDR